MEKCSERCNVADFKDGRRGLPWNIKSFKSSKVQGNEFSTRASREEHGPVNTLILAYHDLCWPFNLQEFQIINLHCIKTWSLCFKSVVVNNTQSKIESRSLPSKCLLSHSSFPYQGHFYIVDIYFQPPSCKFPEGMTTWIDSFPWLTVSHIILYGLCLPYHSYISYMFEIMSLKINI